MKKILKICLPIMLGLGLFNTIEAAVVMVGGPGVVLSYRQPIQAVITDSNGNTYEQTVYYDPAISGVDLNVGWAGPNASVYFPTYGTRYLSYNGYWVNEAGNYWDGGRVVYVGHPHWNDYWSGYWGGHRYYGGWHHDHHPEVSVHVHETTIHEYGGHHHHH